MSKRAIRRNTLDGFTLCGSYTCVITALWLKPTYKSHSHVIVIGSCRCIGADQTRKLDGADSMTGSEKPRQINLKIGGATRAAVDGRTEPVNKNQHGIPSDQTHRRPASADFLGRKQFDELLP